MKSNSGCWPTSLGFCLVLFLATLVAVWCLQEDILYLCVVQSFLLLLRDKTDKSSIVHHYRKIKVRGFPESNTYHFSVLPVGANDDVSSKMITHWIIPLRRIFQTLQNRVHILCPSIWVSGNYKLSGVRCPSPWGPGRTNGNSITCTWRERLREWECSHLIRLS